MKKLYENCHSAHSNQKTLLGTVRKEIEQSDAMGQGFSAFSLELQTDDISHQDEVHASTFKRNMVALGKRLEACGQAMDALEKPLREQECCEEIALDNFQVTLLIISAMRTTLRTLTASQNQLNKFNEELQIRRASLLMNREAATSTEIGSGFEATRSPSLASVSQVISASQEQIRKMEEQRALMAGDLDDASRKVQRDLRWAHKKVLHYWDKALKSIKDGREARAEAGKKVWETCLESCLGFERPIRRV